MIEPIADSETKEGRLKRLNRERQQRYRERQNANINGDEIRAKRQNWETPEQRKLRIAAVVQAARERRAEETQQQRKLRQIKDALATRARRDRETENQRELRLAAVAQAARERRAKETPQQREIRRMTNALATQARRDRETEHQRQLRLAAVAQSIREMRKNKSAEDHQECLRQRRAQRKRGKESQHHVDQAKETTNRIYKQFSKAKPTKNTSSNRTSGIFTTDVRGRWRDEASDCCESNTDDNILKAADALTRTYPSNLPAVKIEISPTQLIEYNEPQAIRTAVLEDPSVDKSVLTSDGNNFEESDASNLEEFEDDAMETVYLSSDNEAADQSTTHKEDEMDCDTDKLLSIKREPEVFEKNDVIDISCDRVRIKTEPQMLEEEHIEWNAVQTHPQAIKVESIEIKTEPHHMLENAQAEGNSGNGIAIKREIITRENDEREKRSDEQRAFMLNQNSIDSIVKMENDIHCDQHLSLAKLPRTKEACGHDFFPDDIDTPEEAMKLLEMLAIYAATTENFRAMIVLSQLEEALQEESN